MAFPTDYPNDIQNGDIPDADEVMANFNAISAYFAALGLDASGIPYSALNLTASITGSDIVDGTVGTGEIANSAVTYAKIAAPVISYGYPAGDVVSPGANAAATIAQVTPGVAGTYLIGASVSYIRTSAAGGSCRMRSRLYIDFTQLYPEHRTDPTSDVGDTIEISHQHFGVVTLTAAQAVTLQGDSVQSGTFKGADSYIQATRIAAS